MMRINGKAVSTDPLTAFLRTDAVRSYTFAFAVAECAACVLLLCGCTPALQQKLKQERTDEAAYGDRSREHAAAEHCSQMLPGTPEHMACMLAASKPKP